MTHTLHRMLRENEQDEDYVMFSMQLKDIMIIKFGIE